MKKSLFPLKPGVRNKEDRIILSVVNNLFSVSILSLMTVLIGAILDGMIISNFLSETAFAAFGLTGPPPGGQAAGASSSAPNQSFIIRSSITSSKKGE